MLAAGFEGRLLPANHWQSSAEISDEQRVSFRVSQKFSGPLAGFRRPLAGLHRPSQALADFCKYSASHSQAFAGLRKLSQTFANSLRPSQAFADICRRDASHSHTVADFVEINGEMLTHSLSQIVAGIRRYPQAFVDEIRVIRRLSQKSATRSGLPAGFAKVSEAELALRATRRPWRKRLGKILSPTYLLREGCLRTYTKFPPIYSVGSPERV